MDMARSVSVGVFVLVATVACAQTFEHKDIGNQITKSEYESDDAHVVVSGTGGEMLYGSTTGTLNVLDAGTAGYVLRVSDGTPYPEWTSTTLAVTPVPTPTPIPTATPVAHAMVTTLTVGNGATSYTLPAADGTASQTLLTDGVGDVDWVGWPTPMPTATPGDPSMWVADGDVIEMVTPTPLATGTPVPYNIKVPRYHQIVNGFNEGNLIRAGYNGEGLHIGDVYNPQEFLNGAPDEGITIGYDASATYGQHSVVIGRSAGTQGETSDGVVAIGHGALGGSSNYTDQIVAIGKDAAYNLGAGDYSTASVVIGHQALYGDEYHLNYESTVVGGRAGYDAAGDSLTFLGVEAGMQSEGDSAIHIGKEAGKECLFDEVLSIGVGTVLTGANQAVFGGENAPYNTVYFGKGAESSTPTDYTISGTDASSGSNADGGDVILKGGDGDGAGGNGEVQVSGDLTVSGSLSPWPTPVVDPSETPAGGDLLVYMAPYFLPTEPGAAVTPVPIDWAGSPSDGEVLAWSTGDGEYAPVNSMSLSSVAAATVDATGEYTFSDDYLLGRISATTHVSGPVEIHGGVDPTATPVVEIDATGNVAARGGLSANVSNGNNDLYYGKQTAGLLLFGDVSEGYLGVNNASPGVAMDVTGDAEISGDLDVGSSALTATQSTGDVTVGNDLDVGGALDVTGAATFDSTTTISGSPDVELALQTASDDATLTMDAADDSWISFEVGGANRWWVVANEGSSEFIVRDTANDSNPFRIDAGCAGNLLCLDDADRVGVNTLTPDSTLEVNGTIHATNLDGTAVNLTANASGQIIRDPSDRNLKTIVAEKRPTGSSALATVRALKPERFAWREESGMGTGREEIGLIAQDVEAVLPEAVSWGTEEYIATEDDGTTHTATRRTYASIRYPVVIGVMVSAMQEQDRQIAAQAAALAALEARVEAQNANFEKRLRALEKASVEAAK